MGALGDLHKDTGLRHTVTIRTQVFFLKELLYLFIYLFIYFYFWLCWVFVSVRGPSPVVASGGHSSSRCAGLSLSRPLLLQSTGSRRAGSAVVAHGPTCSAACGILPDQASNLCPLHRQADSQPLRHQGSPEPRFSDSKASVLNHYTRLLVTEVPVRDTTSPNRNSSWLTGPSGPCLSSQKGHLSL